MLGKMRAKEVDLSAEYHEETVHVPVIITILVILLIAIPFSLWIYNIDEAGKLSSNVSEFELMAATIDSDVKSVTKILRTDAREMQALDATRKAGTVRLIIPEVVIVENRKTNSDADGELNIEIDGIYWSPANPLVTIGGETYRVGDMIQGHEIVKIGKRSVTFKRKDGKLVEKDIYEDLLQTR